MTALRSLSLVAVLIFLFACTAPGVQPDEDFTTAGDPIIFNASGGWCWFQDERAIIDGNSLIFGSVDGSSDEKGGAVQVTAFDMETGSTTVTTVYRTDDDWDQNDHLTPALIQRPDGRYMVAYSRHASDRWSRWRLSEEPGDATRWTEERRHDAVGVRDSGQREDVTYSNLYRLSDEGRTYNFVRGLGFDPNYQILEDGDDEWRYGGRLFDTQDSGQRPYLRYASNGRDEIHFIATEAHPRAYPNSVYHGFIRNGTVYQSDGEALGPLSDTHESEHLPTDLTRVFEGSEDRVAWTSDIQLDSDGHPYIAYSITTDQIGVGEGGMDHRYGYARWDGYQWHDNEIAYAGTRLYPREDEYTGLITLDPTDPDRVYISTNVDPDSGEPLISEADGEQRYEIFLGTTDDGGSIWSWTAITENSSEDNIRPVVTAGENGRALLWMRGTYRTYQDYETQIVGYLEHAPQRNWSVVEDLSHPEFTPDSSIHHVSFWQVHDDASEDVTVRQRQDLERTVRLSGDALVSKPLVGTAGIHEESVGTLYVRFLVEEDGAVDKTIGLSDEQRPSNPDQPVRVRITAAEGSGYASIVSGGNPQPASQEEVRVARGKWHDLWLQVDRRRGTYDVRIQPDEMSNSSSGSSLNEIPLSNPAGPRILSFFGSSERDGAVHLRDLHFSSEERAGQRPQ